MNLTNLKGWLSKDEGEALRGLAQAVPADQAIIELGAYTGKSTCYLGVGANDGQHAPIWTYDLWLGPLGKEAHRIFHRQLRKVKVTVHARRQDTAQAGHLWKGPKVGLLFVDADHEWEAVKADLEAWIPHLAKPATVALHDWRDSHPGVALAAQAILGEPSCLIGSLAVYQ